MLKPGRQNLITCEEARLLMVPRWAGTPGITDGEKQSFDAHLMVCQECTQQYAETQRLMSFVKKHWGPMQAETQQLLEQADYRVVEPNQAPTLHMHPTTVEQGWQDFCKRYPELGENTATPKIRRLVCHIAALAACLAVGILTWLIFSSYSRPQSPPYHLQPITPVIEPSVKVELVNFFGNMAIPTGQNIVAGKEIKTLLINDKHHLIMNTDTILSVEPLVRNNCVGCLVTLIAGEIYTNVKHDGNPFEVSTSHGRAIITGTTFDIKVSDAIMGLVVAEGTVRLESEGGCVDVTKDHRSEIASHSTPSRPIPCEAANLVAWATPKEPVVTKTSILPLLVEYDLGSLSNFQHSSPPDITNINYECWIEENRDWFRREFPWIFAQTSELAKQGIHIDYPELLLRSGDIWRFVWPEYSTRQMLDPCSVNNHGVSKRRYCGQKAFEKWISELQNQKEQSFVFDGNLLLRSLHASIYLVKCRTLIGLGIEHGLFADKDANGVTLQPMLEEQIELAYRNQNIIMSMLANIAGKTPCSIQEQINQMDGLITNIVAITSCNGRVYDYEIGE